MDIKDKVVLMTGASSGIGKATAELFIRKGAKVVLAARSLEEVKELAATIPDSIAVAVDMTKPQEIQQMVQQTQAYYGRIDVLINNAGQELNTSLESIDANNFARLMTSDVYGPLVAMQTTIPLMKQQGSGAIVNISSGVLQSARSVTPQAVSVKSALNTNSLNTRTEYTSPGISISLVYPREQNADVPKPVKRRKAVHKKRGTEIQTFDSPESIAEKIVETIEKGIAIEFL
jgi:NADP-dependent 3-hydroxy acid dehydrogenase YdfG